MLVNVQQKIFCLSARFSKNVKIQTHRTLSILYGCNETLSFTLRDERIPTAINKMPSLYAGRCIDTLFVHFLHNYFNMFRSITDSLQGNQMIFLKLVYYRSYISDLTL